VLQKKSAQSFTHDKLKPFAVKMKIFAPKCSADITVYQSTQNLCKFVKDYTSAGGTRQLSCKEIVSDFIEPSNWPSNSSDLNPWIVQFGMLLSSWCIVRNSKTSETSPEQLLGDDQTLINYGAINRWSKIKQRQLMVVNSHGGHTEHRFR